MAHKRLIDLNPGWLFHGGDGVTQHGRPVPRRERVGVAFDCPCGGACGIRAALLFSNPPDGGPPVAEPHWHRDGDTFEALTLTPSILRCDGCGWHGYLTHGTFVPC